MIDPYQLSCILGYTACVYFIFIFALGDNRDRFHSFIIGLLSVTLFLSAPEVQGGPWNAEKTHQYISAKSISVLIHSLSALFLSLVLSFDSKAWKHALVMCVGVFVNIMIVHKLTVSHFWLSSLVYVWYYELLIIISVIQIAISYDGFIAALHRIQDFLSDSADWIRCNTNRIFQGFRSHKIITDPKKKDSCCYDKNDPMYLLEEVE